MMQDNSMTLIYEEFKKVRTLKLPWFMKPYTDFIEEKFNELMVIYKNGGWK